MPIVPVREGFDPSPFAVGYQKPEEVADSASRPGVVEAVAGEASLGFFGTIGRQTLPAMFDSLYFDREPDFDPYDEIDDEYLRANPWMVKPALTGKLDGIHSSLHFSTFEARQREDWQLRQRLGEASTGVSILSGILGYVPDAILGGAALKAAGVAGSIESLTQSAVSNLAARSGTAIGPKVNAFFTSSSFAGKVKDATGLSLSFVKGGNFEKAAKIVVTGAEVGAAGGVTNLAYDQAVRLVSTNRNVEDERFRALEQFGMGAVFSAALTPVLGGIGKLGQAIPSARLEAMRQSLMETVASVDLGKVSEWAKADMEAAQEILKSRPVPPKFIQAPAGANLDAAVFLGQAGTVPAGKQYLTVLRDPNDPTGYDNFVNAVYAVHGKDNVVFLEHPQQFLVDHADEINKLEPIELSPVGRAIVSTLRLINPAATTLERGPTYLARKTARMFWDFTLGTKESAEDSLDFNVNPPAESLQMNYHKWRDDTLQSMSDQFNAAVKAKEKYTFANGKTVEFGSRFRDRSTFGEAVTDYLRQEDRFRRGWQQNAPQAPQSVVEAARASVTFYRAFGEDMAAVGLLDINVLGKRGDYYGTRRYHQRKIIESRQSVIDRLVEQQKKYRDRDYETGKSINPDDLQLDPEAINFKRSGRFQQKDQAGAIKELGLDQADRERITKYAEGQNKRVEELTERDIAGLSSDLRERYVEEVQLLMEGRAKSMVDSITDLSNAHGVRNGFLGGRATQVREVKMDEVEFADILDNDIFGMVQTYSHIMSGNLAARRAVLAEARELDEIVIKATGKSLKDQDYDPRAVIQAVGHNFQEWVDALNRNGKQAEAKKMADSMERHMDLMERKLRELEGSPVFANDTSASVTWNFARFAGRQLLKFPFMSFMGKMGVGNLTDIAALSMYKGMTPQRFSVLRESVNFFKEFENRRALEGLYVATSDVTRNLFSSDIGDIVNYSNGDTPFGPGVRGRMMAWTDRTTDKMANVFTRATGVRRVSTNLKRAAALLIQREIIEGARKMADAADLVKNGGLTKTEAFDRVGLTAEDAFRLNRLGINSNRARRLMDKLDNHAVDMDGNRVNSRHDGWMSPETRQWWNTDRDLFEAFNFAVNSEVLNVIVEPKILSRPLLNNHWIGRAVNQFQSFAFAWGNQLAPMLAQRPAYEAAQYAFAAVGFGILADSLYNQLSGRRSLADSATMVVENPLGLIYGGVVRSPLLGWLSRPIGLLEQTRFGPGKALGNKALSSQYARPEFTAGDLLGPVFGWADNLSRGVSGLFTDGYNDSRARRLWRALPFHNWFVLDGLNRTAEAAGYETPFGPRPNPVR